jgi:phage tail sheath protein FI
MPVTPTYPGVYIEEIPSGVRTITGVATSITAFIGRAKHGPTDKNPNKDNRAVTINSFADFERIYGGLWRYSSLGYAVRDFFLNGGSQAIIVRLYHPDYATDTERTTAQNAAQQAAQSVADAAAAEAGKTTDPKPTPASVAAKARDEANEDANKKEPRKTAADIVATAAERAAAIDGATVGSVSMAASNSLGKAARRSVLPGKTPLDVGGQTLEAAYPGSWGKDLRASVDVNVSDDVAASMGLTKADLFNLTVKDVSPSGRIEQFRNLSLKESPRRIDRVLVAESHLVRWRGTFPPSSLPAVSAADDDVTLKEKDLADKNKALAAARKGSDEDAKRAADAAVKAAQTALNEALDALLASDGGLLTEADFTGQGKADAKEGLYALKLVDLFNILCIPPYLASGDVDVTLVGEAAAYCESRRAMLLVDPPGSWNDKDTAKTQFLDADDKVGTRSKNAALFFPRFKQPDPFRDNQIGEFVPCGAIAGIFARTDTQRGVWKAPAGLDATLVGVPQLSVLLNDAENGELNPLGINCLRAFPAAGRVVWGARTLKGNDNLASEWKYIPVRRLALYIEESLYRGTQWVVFEPNDEPLWAQIRLNVGAFMQNLFRQGAFQGQSPRDAYFVKCDKETTTPNDINLGIVNIVVGFAPLKPAEFVIIILQQMAGQIQV